MININIINHPLEKVKSLLSNGNWKYVDTFEMRSHSEYWCSATLLSLSKMKAANSPEATVYLLQAFVTGDKSEENTAGPDYAAVYYDMLQVYAMTEIKQITATELLNEFTPIPMGINESPGSQLTKNGRTIARIELLDLLHPFTITSATAILNKWNEKRFFIETKENWLYFEWATGA